MIRGGHGSGEEPTPPGASPIGSGFLFLIALAVAGLLALAGCGAKPNPASEAEASLNIVDRGLVGAAAHVRNAQGNVEAAKPHTGERGRGHLEAASLSQDLALNEIFGAENASSEVRLRLDEAEQELDRLRKRTEQLEGDFWSVRQRSLFRIALWLLAAATVLRVVGLKFLGPAGRAASLTSTLILGLITGGISLIQTAFDNLWFRWRAGKATATATAPKIGGDA